jgi:hypothetical protein
LVQNSHVLFGYRKITYNCPRRQDVRVELRETADL